MICGVEQFLGSFFVRSCMRVGLGCFGFLDWLRKFRVSGLRMKDQGSLLKISSQLSRIQLCFCVIF